MQGFSHPVFYAALMFLAGIGIPTMAALNSGLGGKLQSPALAAVILLLVGLLAAIVYLLVAQGAPAKSFSFHAPWYYYCGGFFIMFYILSITWVAPRFGVANAISFVLLGQLLAMSMIDHFGFAGAQQHALTAKRVLGLLLMVAGILMVLSKPEATA